MRTPPVDTPRRAMVDRPGPWDTMDRLGTAATMSDRPFLPVSMISAADRAATELATSCRFCDRFCAVTTMSSTVVAGSAAPDTACAVAGEAARARTTARELTPRYFVLPLILVLPPKIIMTSAPHGRGEQAQPAPVVAHGGVRRVFQQQGHVQIDDLA
ncbi:hypothetical protein D3C80_878240 [compost metagenome]